MSRLNTFDFLELCPHLKSEWRAVSSDQGFIYQHTFSSDQSEVKYLTSQTMKELDLYSSRQAYCFHTSPRVYKYVIQKNHHRGNELLFDLILLVQRVPNRLSSLKIGTDSQEYKMLSARVIDIVKGFHYLYNRFGGFSVSEQMIGWTKEGVVKVWFNTDFSLNRTQNKATLETMVGSLVHVLAKKCLLRIQAKKISTFQSLLKNLTWARTRKQSDTLNREVGIKSFKNLNASFYHTKHPFFKNTGGLRDQDQHSRSKSRKNTTFCFSNKDITMKSTINSRSGEFIKRKSIHADYVQQFTLPSSFRLSAEIRQGNSPSTSFKQIVPYQRRPTYKNSIFKCDKKEEVRVQQKQTVEMKPKKLQEHFSKTTQSSLNRKGQGSELPPAKLAQGIDKENFLHYSTSSNPCKKFFHPNRTQGNKTYSTKGGPYIQAGLDQCQKSISSKNESNTSQISEGTAEQRRKSRKRTQQLKRTGQGPEEGVRFQIPEQGSSMRASQLVQRDLDALFNSDNSFDYNQLQNELDCIL